MSYQYAQDTAVSVEKSRAEIESILTRYGATSFAYMIEDRQSIIGFKANGKFVKFVLPLPNRNEKRFLEKERAYRGSVIRTPEEAHKAWEQACRTRWRSLCLCIKAKLEACTAGITSFEKEFLAHIVLPGGETLAERVIPELEQIYKTGATPRLMLGFGDSQQPDSGNPEPHPSR